MKLRFFLAVLAAFVLVAWWELEGVAGARTPQALLASAERRLERDPPDLSGALREFGLALELTRDARDRDAARDILLRRAAVYASRQSFDLALADYESLLAEHGPNDAELCTSAARTALALENLDRASEMAQRAIDLAPRRTGPRNLLARIAAESARGIQTELEGELDDRLDAEDSRHAREFLDLAIALPPGSPTRRGPLAGLRRMISDEETATRFAREIDRASAELSKARSAWIASLELRVHAEPLAGLFDAYRRAALDLEVACAGRIALGTSPAFASPRVLLVTLGALEALELGAVANPLLGHLRLKKQPVFRFADLSTAELVELVSILRRAETWTELERAARTLQGRVGRVAKWLELGAIAPIHSGLALSQLGRHQDAARALAVIQREHATFDEPFEGALALAFAAKAKSERALERSAAERTSLRRMREFAPAVVLRDGDRIALGEATLRLAEVSAAEGEFALAEEAATRAFELMPERGAFLEKNLRSYGESAMVRRGRDLAATRERWAKGRGRDPGERSGPFEQWQEARIDLDAGRVNAALVMSRRLLAAYPEFPPALLLVGEAYARRRDSERAALALLPILEHAHDERARVLMQDLAHADLPPDLELRWIRAAPAQAVGTRAAEELLALGERDAARAAFALFATDPAHPEAALRAAELALADGDSEQALRWLEKGSPAPAFAQSPSLYLEAALAASASRGSSVQLHRALARLAGLAQVPVEGLAQAADRMAAAGFAEEARLMLATLDASGKSRSPELLLRFATLEQVALRPRAAAQARERARAFFDAGEVELQDLLAAIDARDGVLFEDAARALAAQEVSTDPRTRALLALLVRDTDAAGLALEEAGLPAPDDALRHVLLASVLERIEADVVLRSDEPEPEPRNELESFAAHPLGEGEPRLALALLLACERAHTAAWVIARVDAAEGRSHASPFARHLAARAALALGAGTLADARFAKLLADAPAFVFAWHEREAIARRDGASPHSVRFLTLRLRRLIACGTLGLEERDLLRSIAAWLAFSGKHGPAARVLAAMHGSAAEEAAEIALARARLLVRSGDPLAALPIYHGLVAERGELVREVLGLLGFLCSGGVLSPAAAEAELMALAAERPDDPRPPLAVAQLALASAAPEDLGALERGLRELARFKHAHPGTALDHLERDSASAWIDFAIEHEPETALLWAEEELRHRPISPGAWIDHARVLAAVGARRAALQELATLQEFAPDPGAEILAAELAADLGAGRDLAASALARARALGAPASLLEAGEIAVLRCDLWESGAAGVKARGELRGRLGAIPPAEQRMTALVAGLFEPSARSAAKARADAEAFGAGAREPLEREVFRVFAALARDVEVWAAARVGVEKATEPAEKKKN